MSKLLQIANCQPEFDLDRFVEEANHLLPQFLPDQPAGSRGQEPVTPRLVRYYTTQGLLDKPLKQGREARYTYRHLLQLLVVRRLLAEGYSASSIGSLIDGQDNSLLEKLLQGGAQLTVEAANPALAFLSQIRERGESLSQKEIVHKHEQVSNSKRRDASIVSAPSQDAVSARRSQASPFSETWSRLDVLDGLEIHVREDFVLPSTAHERQRLWQLIEDRLADLNSFRRKSR